MTGFQRLLSDFGQDPLIYTAVLAASGALVVSLVGMAMGNHANGYRLRKLLIEVLGAAGLAAAFATAIAASGYPLLVSAGIGAAWSALYQYVRIGVTRILLMRYDHFSDGLAE